MARQLQALIATLGLEAKAFRLRDGSSAGELPVSDSDAVTWDLVGHTHRVGRDDYGATFEGVQGDRWTARARLTASSSWKFTTDSDYDTSSNGPRTARTPTLEASALRAWYGAELAYYEPDATTSVLFRLYDADTGDQLYWTGSEWAAGVDGDDTVATWSSAQDVQDNLASLPHDVRKLAIMAWLRTSSEAYSPEFYGVRLAYGVRQVSSLDDALYRTVLQALQDELDATGVVEATWPSSGPASITLPESGFPYNVTGLDGAWNLDTDPDELTDIAGSYTVATRLWVPSSAPAGGEVYRAEFRYSPDLVVRRHQDLEVLASLPAVYLAVSGAPPQVLRAQGYVLVRDTNASPPTALELPDPEVVTVPLELRVVAELPADVDRLSQALTRWLSRRPPSQVLGAPGAHGLGLSRDLVSPSTGQVVNVRAVGRPTASAAGLAQGVAEARAAWLLTFPRASAHTTITVPLVSETGPTFATVPLEA